MSMNTSEQHAPLEESSSIGCLNAVMSLNVHRKSTTFSCSFRIGAIFTKNQTGIPGKTQPHTRYFSFEENILRKNLYFVLSLFYTFMHIHSYIKITNLCTTAVFLPTECVFECNSHCFSCTSRSQTNSSHSCQKLAELSHMCPYLWALRT